MNLAKYDRVYFIGIGGIGMSALARYFKQMGNNVAGYDKSPTELTEILEEEGFKINFEDQIQDIPSYYKNIEKTLIVYTPAVPQNHAQLNYFKDNLFDVYKRAFVVAQIANSGNCIAVAGTHGKTTTSTLIAHILKSNKKNITAFLGGISTNYNSNFLIGRAREVVIEADEYDRSFLNLKPNLAVLTSMDADHLDIYKDSSDLENTFKAFLAMVKPDGLKIVNAKLGLEGITYSIDKKADYEGKNISTADGQYYFDVHFDGQEVRNIKCGLPGRHNVENAVAAFAACHKLGLSGTNIAKAIESFTGVKRRFQYHIKSEKITFIDDYAHHPQELKSLINSARELFPEKKLTLVFQPHLFSRTKDFADDFAVVLSTVDQLLLLDIYPAREEPIPGVTSEGLLKNITVPTKRLVNKTELVSTLLNLNPEFIITAGAGDIDKLIKPIKLAFEND